MTSSNGSPSRWRLVGPGEQLADLQALGADAVDRRDRAVEDVVEALELGRPLEREHVERLLDDAQPALVAARVAADRAQRLVADVEAALAEDDLVAHGDERRGERPRLRVGRAQQVVGQALGGLRADAGQAGERLDEPGDGLDERAWPRRRSHPRDAQAAGHRGHLLLGQLARGAEGVVDGGDDEVLEHLDVVGVDRATGRS